MIRKEKKKSLSEGDASPRDKDGCITKLEWPKKIFGGRKQPQCEATRRVVTHKVQRSIDIASCPLWFAWYVWSVVVNEILTQKLKEVGRYRHSVYRIPQVIYQDLEIER